MKNQFFRFSKSRSADRAYVLFFSSQSTAKSTIAGCGMSWQSAMPTLPCRTTFPASECKKSSPIRSKSEASTSIFSKVRHTLEPACEIGAPSRTTRLLGKSARYSARCMDVLFECPVLFATTTPARVDSPTDSVR